MKSQAGNNEEIKAAFNFAFFGKESDGFDESFSGIDGVKNIRDHEQKLFEDLGIKKDSSYYGIDTKDWFSACENSEVNYQYTGVYDFLNNAPGKLLDEKKAEPYQQQLKGILQKFISSDKSPNKELKDLIDEYGGLDKVQFNILNNDHLRDAHAGFSRKKAKNGGNAITINVTSSCFENPDMLPNLIAHELGHVMDYSKRSDGYPGSLKEPEEHFADAFGRLLAKNAGYTSKNLEAFAEETAKHGPLEKIRAENMNKYAEADRKEEQLKEMMLSMGTHRPLANNPQNKNNTQDISKEKDVLSNIFGRNRGRSA